jgi:hypothetical protein
MSFLTLFAGLAWAFYRGGTEAVTLVTILVVIEISLSFDNAVVNATVLENLNSFWRKFFLTIGMLIAVFGMRLVFPISIVSNTTDMSFMEVYNLAISNPEEYSQKLESVEHMISAFGGTFLLMVFLDYFIDSEKETHWFHWAETRFIKFGEQIKHFEISIVLIFLALGCLLLNDKTFEIKFQFLASGLIGLFTFIAVKGFGNYLSGKSNNLNNTFSYGLRMVIYLEVLDASFSFDGVMGAFAVTKDVFNIMVGLGIGAMFVRSLTVFLVDKNTLTEYRFIEHGAFWGIGNLAIISLIGMKYEVPEYVTGILSAGVILLSLWHSIKENKKDLIDLAK